jgi:hypothetical protein
LKSRNLRPQKGLYHQHLEVEQVRQGEVEGEGEQEKEEADEAGDGQPEPQFLKRNVKIRLHERFLWPKPPAIFTQVKHF